MADVPLPAAAVCSGCGSEVAPSMLSCPSCRRLTRAEEIGRVAAEAEQAEAAGALVTARDAWRRVHGLLPTASRQSETIAERIASLNRAIEADPKAASEAEAGDRPAWARRLGPLGVVLLFAVTKGKLLLVGLTKAGTLLSMTASFGVYWAAWGWRFALGLVASVYVHEMGHVAAMRRYGIEATAPMFLPGLGAMVRSKQYPVDPVENARVALAGPLWGLGAALAAYAGFFLTHVGVLAAVAQVAAWINLFNLLSVPPLDGDKAFSALTETQRWLLVGVLAAALALTRERLLILLLIAAFVRSMMGRAAARADARTLAEFAILIAALSAMCLIPVPSASVR